MTVVVEHFVIHRTVSKHIVFFHISPPFRRGGPPCTDNPRRIAFNREDDRQELSRGRLADNHEPILLDRVVLIRPDARQDVVERVRGFFERDTVLVEVALRLRDVPSKLEVAHVPEDTSVVPSLDTWASICADRPSEDPSVALLSSGRLPAMIESAASLTKCTNCGADAADVYCARCGEKQPGHHDLGVSHFTHEVFHELAHVDSKLFRTLRDLITKPGFLTQEYFAGRKSRYIAPLRLFLTLFALQFLAFTVYTPAAKYSVVSLKRFDKAGALTKLLERRAVKRHLTREEFEQRLDEQF